MATETFICPSCDFGYEGAPCTCDMEYPKDLATLPDEGGVVSSGAANVRRDAEKDEFLAGYLCAVQNLAIGFGMDCTAELLLQESGYSLKSVLQAQKENGFETRRMNKIIRSALED